jgi:hypothetical protein
MAHADLPEDCDKFRRRIAAIQELFDRTLIVSARVYSVPKEHREKARQLMKKLKADLKAKRTPSGGPIFKAAVHVSVKWNSVPNRTWWDELGEADIDLTDPTR